ncbi:unnamed protein product [Linum tenue]|uniref:Uncharacterized protein n=1 Tax=Linum tenue TaxID=586396 RepID=A0AAV0GQ90_9ROSI|nr:unnamed protein product [Linum tenue]
MNCQHTAVASRTDNTIQFTKFHQPKNIRRGCHREHCSIWKS